VETAHALGIRLVMHSCGNVLPLLEWFADCGFDAVQSLEPTAGVTLKEAKALVGDRLCLIGNIDVSEVLVGGTREEVFEAVRQAIQDAGRGGGFILSPAHNHSGVSVERLRWMLEAARQYGGYPLP
jgi:uroporphyrinogen decarboxylase